MDNPKPKMSTQKAIYILTHLDRYVEDDPDIGMMVMAPLMDASVMAIKALKFKDSVVRCKDCVYAKKNYLVNGLCLCEKPTHDAIKGEVPRNTLMTEDDFCSYGERRTNDEL